ncbi:MAG: DUF4290 domain-containing protein [Flavobacteriales bacterium]|nr:DUF4290 domain-containing protein [Flavobacteriales bacterium]
MEVPFDYNTQRPRLIIPEYGRNVQRMVQHCMDMPEREARTRTAKAIIQVIGRLNPQLRISDNFERTLWDHLWIMSEFKLDVDAPYPMPTPEELDSKPERVPYPQAPVKFGHYGRTVERMIKQCAELEAGEKKDAYSLVIANLMKRQFLVWNRDTVPDTVILKDLAELSKGKVKLGADAQLAHTADLLRAHQAGPRNEVDNRKPRSGNNNNNRKRHRRKKNRY